MKKILALILAVCLMGIFIAVEAETAPKSAPAKPKLEPYGFLKGDMIYADNPVMVFGKQTIVSPAIPMEGDANSLSFTAQHTRVGLKGSVGVGKAKIGGKVEMDFFSNVNDANTKPRLRLAYAQCNVQGLDIRIGQQWDVFSPLNPTTNNTNANMWYAGNFGFRRTMFRIGYTIPLEGVKPGIIVCAAEGTKDGTPGPGLDNLSEVPQLQGRLFVGFLEGYAVGVAGLYTTYTADRNYSTWGFSADLNLPFHKFFAIKGEFGMGTNLNNANFFTIAGNKYIKDDNDVVVDSTDKESIGFWFNAISKPIDFLHIVFGMGMEKNTTDDLAAGTIESNMAIYGTLIFPIGKFFSLSIEAEMLKAKLKTADRGDDDILKANVLDIAGKIVF